MCHALLVQSTHHLVHTCAHLCTHLLVLTTNPAPSPTPHTHTHKQALESLLPETSDDLMRLVLRHTAAGPRARFAATQLLMVAAQCMVREGGCVGVELRGCVHVCLCALGVCIGACWGAASCGCG